MKNKLTKIVSTFALGALLLAACGNEESAPTPEGTQGSASDIEKIVVGTEGTYAPYSYHDESGELVGYDIDIARAVGEEIGAEVEFMEVKWEGLLQGIDTGQIDVVFNQVGVSEERKEKYLFTEPYLYGYPVLVTRKDNTTIHSFEDAEGFKTALNVSTNYARIADEYGVSYISSETYNNAIELLLSERIDLIINDGIAFADLKKERPDIPLEIRAQLDQPSVIAAPVKKDNVELQEAISEALKTLSDNGTLTELSEKYLGEDFSQKQ